MKTKSKPATEDQFGDWSHIQDFNNYHQVCLSNWEEITDSPDWAKLSDEQMYERYLEWHIKSFSKLGRVLA